MTKATKWLPMCNRLTNLLSELVCICKLKHFVIVFYTK